MEAAAAPCQGHAVRGLSLRKIELQGFKSFNGTVTVGDLFGSFTCIVGPNGCGKSVVGEAIAFALGGNARMLRAANLGLLVNNTPGAPEAPTAAQVTLTFDVGECGSARDIGSSGSQGSPSAATACGQLRVRRRVTASGRSELALFSVPAAGRHALGPPADSAGRWQAVTHAQLGEQLRPYGIQLEAVDRFVVTQHRQAVHVQDPVRLAQFLELLIGTSGYAQRLDELAQQAQQAAQECNATEDRLDELELQRQQLAPEVAKWRAYEAALQAHQGRKLRTLRRQAVLLGRHQEGLQQACAAVGEQAGEAASAQAAAREAADGLLRQRAKAAEGLRKAEKKQGKLGQAAQQRQVECAKLGVRLRAAVEAAAQSSKRARQAEGQLGQLRRGAARKEAELRAAQQEVQDLSAACEAAASAAEELRLQEREGSGAAPEGLEAQVGSAARQAQAAAELLSTLHEQHDAAGRRVEALQQEASRQAAAAEGSASRQAQLEGQVAQHAQQAGELQAEAQAAAPRLEAARQEQYAQQAASQHLQSTLHAVLQQLQGPGPQDAEQGGRQSVDQAVAALAAAAANGRLPGGFYGRLHSVARVAQPAVAVAVNAALVEVCNLSSCLVVGERRSAQSVVEHFRRHRVGVATCKILAELQSTAGATRDAQMDALLAGDGKLRPLCAFVEAHPEVPSAQGLLGHLLHNWWLAPDRAAALAAAQQGRSRGGTRRNIVTKQGEVFKADGEIVGCRTPPAHLRPYLLGSQFEPVGGAAGNGQAGAAAAGEREELEQQAAEVRAQLAAAQHAEQQAVAQAEAAAAAAGAAQQAQAAAAAELAQARRQLQAESDRQGKLGKQGRKLQQQLAAGQQELEAAARPLGEAQAREAALQKQHQQLQARYEAALRQTKAGSQLLAADAKLRSQQKLLQGAQARAAAAGAAAAQVVRQQQLTVAAQRGEDEAAAEVERLRGLVERAQGQSLQEAAEAEQVESTARELRQLSRQLDADWRAAVKAHEAATTRCQRLQAQLRQLQAQRQQGERNLAGVRQALVELQAGAAAETSPRHPGATEEEDGVEQTPSAAHRAGGGSSSSSEGGSAEEEEEEEEEAAPRQRRRLSTAGRQGPAASATSKQQQQRRSSRRRGRSMQHESAASEEQGVMPPSCSQAGGSRGRAHSIRSSRVAVVESSDSDDGGSGAKLPYTRVQRGAGQGRERGRAGAKRAGTATAEGHATEERENMEEVEAALAALEEEEQKLQGLHAALNGSAVEADALAERQAAAAEAQLEEAEGCLRALEVQRDSLRSERYNRFHAAVQLVNAQLGGVYQGLTGGQGDAYISYAEDRLAAFAEGVTFHVRPDRHRWRPFGTLSGGQQALATLAVCFALQAAFPSPFYFFDEIDCALDTVNAARVASYIASRRDAQYLVVSHKPQVYECAGCLVGVYSRHASSQAATLHLGAPQSSSGGGMAEEQCPLA